MLIEKLKDEKNLTPSERVIAEFVLDRDNDVINLSSEELGKLTYTSQATVTRFYQKIGSKSYREFVVDLNNELQELRRAENLIVDNNPIHDELELEDIIETLPNLYQKTAINTKLLLDRKVLQHVCEKIVQAKMVDVYGIGITSSLADQMAFKLNSTGVFCQSHSGYNGSYVYKSAHKNETVAVLITLTGMNETILKIAKRLKKNHVYTVVIGGGRAADLLDYCDELIKLDTNRYFHIDTLSSLFSAQYIIDIIFSALLVELNHQKIGLENK
ncbi:MurR/RpiR family transcriptional regulator [Vagococcus elongatus]|uniref:HTH rpiR-type domain-containing protein n=1 Tax=Vagococcus elongatus TaxID=180344 RepID=A0A430AZQ4_9ENTE|nr:MurR/RpiR family transcriptional regulator [Vagococcus elongatus]RSU13539.1 hypothetical protein CBF29_04610 [Vagococcus elongatus]